MAYFHFTTSTTYLQLTYLLLSSLLLLGSTLFACTVSTSANKSRQPFSSLSMAIVLSSCRPVLVTSHFSFVLLPSPAAFFDCPLCTLSFHPPFSFVLSCSRLPSFFFLVGSCWFLRFCFFVRSFLSVSFSFVFPILIAAGPFSLCVCLCVAGWLLLACLLGRSRGHSADVRNDAVASNIVKVARWSEV